MNQEEKREPALVPRPWQPRFSIAGMLMLMLIVCVMAAAGSYFARALRDDSRPAHLVFLLMTLAAPMMLMIVVSILRQIFRGSRRRR
jgi:ABC-type bacteriocin/lantibiotic exporter with double-glycine peptidase domain